MLMDIEKMLAGIREAGERYESSPRRPRPPMLMVWDGDAGEYVEARGKTCTALCASETRGRKAGDICGQRATQRIGDSPVCPHHYERAANHHFEMDIEERRRRFAIMEKTEAELKAAAKRLDAIARDRGLIYYVARADGLIKIGTSRQIAQRFRALKVRRSPGFSMSHRARRVTVLVRARTWSSVRATDIRRGIRTARLRCRP
jgi:hypothetical protein